MIDLNDLLEQVWPMATQQAVPTESVSLNNALGRVLAQDVFSSLNVPQHDNSGMDGYAVCCTDIQPSRRFQISQRVPAGASPQPLQRGTVARIFTGAPIPPRADSVVMQEDVVVNDDGSVTFSALPKSGQWIRRAGEDIASGQVVLSQGTRLDAIHVGLLASIGVPTVSVNRRLKVGVMVTGSELQSPGQLLQPGQIYNSNEYVWCGLLEAMHADVRSVGIVPDNFEATCAALESLADCDAVISSPTGVSSSAMSWFTAARKRPTSETALAKSGYCAHKWVRKPPTVAGENAEFTSRLSCPNCSFKLAKNRTFTFISSNPDTTRNRPNHPGLPAALWPA